jgi:hypothetical protein
MSGDERDRVGVRRARGQSPLRPRTRVLDGEGTATYRRVLAGYSSRALEYAADAGTDVHLQ